MTIAGGCRSEEALVSGVSVRPGWASDAESLVWLACECGKFWSIGRKAFQLASFLVVVSCILLAVASTPVVVVVVVAVVVYRP
jgi:hypothetical protein